MAKRPPSEFTYSFDSEVKSVLKRGTLVCGLSYFFQQLKLLLPFIEVAQSLFSDRFRLEARSTFTLQSPPQLNQFPRAILHQMRPSIMRNLCEGQVKQTFGIAVVHTFAMLEHHNLSVVRGRPFDEPLR